MHDGLDSVRGDFRFATPARPHLPNRIESVGKKPRTPLQLALGAEVGKDVEEVTALLDREFARRPCGLGTLPPVDTVLWVGHGPLHYEDQRLMIETESDMPTVEALRACFTKRTKFVGQQEYRFAMRVAGRPLRKAIYFQGSGELLRLTRRVDADVGR